tara:strand:+ start:13942 stop:15000 length:1059 start_codon:yes stop_codon:yes gene_type:complete
LLKVFTDIDSVKEAWCKIKLPNILDINFLEIYCKEHPKLTHLLIMDNNMRLYAHIFKLKFNKTKGYLKNNSVFNIVLSFIKFDVLYLTNSFITNIPSFISDKLISLNILLDSIKDNYSIIVIPDFLFKHLRIEKDNYVKIEVEEEMILDIRSEWTELTDYVLDLKTKYRNKVKRIIKKTSVLEIRDLKSDDLNKYIFEMKFLFSQVVEESRFRGPDFDTSSFASFVEKGFMRVEGYFLNEELVGFSSYIENKQILYSYFTGFNKNINKSIPIYGRILIENIKHAINLKKDRLVLGRTANEYKSNFGASPVRSYVYLRIRNRFARILLRPIYTNLRINKWEKRNPFKAKNLLV